MQNLLCSPITVLISIEHSTMRYFVIQAEFHSPTEGCLPCNCDPENSEDNFCDTVTGQCTCFEESGPFIDSQRLVN